MVKGMKNFLQGIQLRQNIDLINTNCFFWLKSCPIEENISHNGHTDALPTPSKL